MDNILSQNRYVYVVNNPINYADPDGHKAVGSTIKNTASAMAANTRKAAQEAKNRTSKAAETAAGKSGKGAAAVFMAANQITRNEVKGVSQGTTKGVDAAKTGIVAEASADEINRAAQEKAAHSQAKADFVSMPLDALNSAGAWLDKGFTNLAGYIDASWAGEWVGSAAEWVTQKECAAYNYCINGLQEFLPNSDVERILDGSGLILMGGFKMAGGAFLTFAGALTSYTGIGLGGMAAGTVTGVSGISDIEQGINEIKLGLRNDSTTRTGNYVRDTLYDGNDTIYHLSTGTAAMAGMALRPYVMPKKNPVLAGGKQKDIAEKAAMGEKRGSGVRNRQGQPVPVTEKTLDMALDPETYANTIAEKYGINLRGAGQDITIKYNPDLRPGIYGRTTAANPNVIEIGPDALMREAELANTIAHELNHARDFMRGGIAPEPSAYSAGNALADYINGGR